MRSFSLITSATKLPTLRFFHVGALETERVRETEEKEGEEEGSRERGTEGGRDRGREGGRKDIKPDSFIHSVSIFRILSTKDKVETKCLGSSLLVGLKL